MSFYVISNYPTQNLQSVYLSSCNSFLPLLASLKPPQIPQRSTLCSSGFSIRLIAVDLFACPYFFSRSRFNRSICLSAATTQSDRSDCWLPFGIPSFTLDGNILSARSLWISSRISAPPFTFPVSSQELLFLVVFCHLTGIASLIHFLAIISGFHRLHHRCVLCNVL